jgi:hypothetical protein
MSKRSCEQLPRRGSWSFAKIATKQVDQHCCFNLLICLAGESKDNNAILLVATLYHFLLLSTILIPMLLVLLRC